MSSEPEYLSVGQHDRLVAVSTYVGPSVDWPQTVRTRAQITVGDDNACIITLGWRQMAQLQDWLARALEAPSTEP